MPRKKVIREIRLENDNMKVEFLTQNNKFDYEKKLAYIDYKGVRTLPMYTLTFFSLDEDFLEIDEKTKFSKRNDMLRKSIQQFLKKGENDEYNKTLVEGVDYFVLTKEDNEEDMYVYDCGLKEIYEHTTKNIFKFGSASKIGYLFTIEGAKLLLSNFNFSRDYVGEDRKIVYQKQVRDRAIYFTRTEELIKNVFDVEINVHTWFYLTGNQMKGFVEYRKEIIDKLLNLHDEYYKEDEYKYAFGMTKATEETRYYELKSIFEMHIDDTLGHKEKLSYRCINYTSLQALKNMRLELLKGIEENKDYREYILDLVKMYKPLKTIVKYGGMKVFEQYMFNKKYSKKDKLLYNSLNEVEFVRDKDEDYHNKTLRNKILTNKTYVRETLQKVTSNVEHQIDNQLVDDIYDNCLITTYLNKLREYQETLKEFHCLHYDMTYNKDKNGNLIGFSYMDFLKNELRYGYNYTMIKHAEPLCQEDVDRCNEYVEKVNEFEANVKIDLLNLREKVINLKNNVLQLSTYLQEYLKDEIRVKLYVRDKDKKVDLSSFIDGSLNNSFDVSIYENEAEIIENKSTYVKKTHINKLLED